MLQKIFHREKTRHEVRTVLNLGFYKRMSIKQIWDKPPEARAEMSIKVAGTKSLFGTAYSVSLDNGFRDAGIWQSILFDSVLPDRDGYIGNAEFVVSRTGEFMANSMKTHPEAGVQYMMMANALEHSFSKVAQTIGDKTVLSASVGMVTYDVE